MMSTIGGGGGGGGVAAGHAPSGATLGKRVQVVARVRAHLPGETVDSDLNISGNGCKITLVPPAKSKSDRRTEFLFDDVFVPDCRPEDLCVLPQLEPHSLYVTAAAPANKSHPLDNV